MYSNIEPFLALPGSVMRERAAMLVDSDDDRRWHRTSFTFRIRGGVIADIFGPGMHSSRARDQQSLFEEFVAYLPDMDMTFTEAEYVSVRPRAR